MSEITKKQFLKKFEGQIVGDDSKGYNFKSFTVPISELSEITKREIATLADLENLLDGNNEDEVLNLNNQIMSFIFGEGEDYRGSYQEKKGSGDYCWYLDHGNIEIDSSNDFINYSGVRFYRG